MNVCCDFGDGSGMSDKNQWWTIRDLEMNADIKLELKHAAWTTLRGEFTEILYRSFSNEFEDLSQMLATSLSQMVSHSLLN